MLRKISLMTSRVWPRSTAGMLVMMAVVIVMMRLDETRSGGRAGFLHHGLQRDVVLGRDSSAVVVFGGRGDRAVALGKFHFDTTPSRLDLANLAAQLEPRDRMKTHADSRGLREQHLGERIAARRLGQDRNRDGGTAL